MCNSILASAYIQVGIPLDRLPYSPAFRKLKILVERLSGELIEDAILWSLLLRLRKDGDLPRVRRA